MSVALAYGPELGSEQRTAIFPNLIEANHILTLSGQDLVQAVEAELVENPALEIEDAPLCPVCRSPLEGLHCTACLGHSAPPAEPTTREQFDRVQQERQAQDDAVDPLSYLATDTNLREQLLADARTLLRPDEFVIAEWLVANLDDRGYLGTSLEEIAADLGRCPEAVERVLLVVQQCAPVGVAARDLRECLQLQLDYLRRQEAQIPPLVARIVDHDLTLLGTHTCGAVAKRLGLPTEEVEEARDFIRRHLTPFPLQRQEARSWQHPSEATYVVPDIMILPVAEGFAVEVLEPRHCHLRLNDFYAAIAAPTPLHQQAEATITAPERRHVREYSGRARTFIANIRQRREILLKIARYVVEAQEDFLREGVQELRPLTRGVVAQQVGVHESTVSRATANKYVMLPNRKVIPFSDFFTASLSAKDVIRQMITEERHSGTRLTDREICERLLRQGIRIARRTVAKYRAELGILAVSVR